MGRLAGWLVLEKAKGRGNEDGEEQSNYVWARLRMRWKSGLSIQRRERDLLGNEGERGELASVLSRVRVTHALWKRARCFSNEGGLASRSGSAEALFLSSFSCFAFFFFLRSRGVPVFDSTKRYWWSLFLGWFAAACSPVKAPSLWLLFMKLQENSSSVIKTVRVCRFQHE